jgi:hypothetical protein
LYYTTLDWKVMVVGVKHQYGLRSTPAKLLFQAPQQSSKTAGDYRVDGKQAAQTPFTVVLNWQAGLKK